MPPDHLWAFKVRLVKRTLPIIDPLMILARALIRSFCPARLWPWIVGIAAWLPIILVLAILFSLGPAITATRISVREALNYD